jgi:hypothetical protein
MPNTGRDILISTLILCAGLLALGWFLLASPGLAAPEGTHMLALVLGGLVAFFGLFLVLNFRVAHRQVSRLAAGQGVVARWHIGPAALAGFLELDRGFPTPNGWRPSRRDRRDGAEVIFGEEMMVLGSRFQALPSTGLQSVQDVRLEGGPVLCLAVVTRSLIREGGRMAPVDTLWRIPVIDAEAANAVVRHYRAVLSGQLILAPNRWKRRLRAGIALTVLLPVVGLVGWALLNRPGLTGEAEVMVPLVMTLLGILGTIGAAIFTALVWTFERRNRGR